MFIFILPIHAGTDVLLVTHDNELLVYGSNSQRGLCQNRDKKAAKQVFYDVNNLVKIEELSDKPIKGYNYFIWFNIVLFIPLFVRLILKTITVGRNFAYRNCM